MVPPTHAVDHPGTARCPEPLCLPRALLASGWRPAPPRRALPLLRRSDELMRQTKTLHHDFVFPHLYRAVFAGCGQPLLGVGPSRRCSASLSQDAWAQIPAGRRVHVPVSSPPSSAFPKSRRWVGFPHRSAQRLQSGGYFEIVAIPYVQASWFVRHPGLSYRCGTDRRAAVTFTSEQNMCRCLHMHRICSPSEPGN